MGRLEGKVAFITGAASGIGKATAERLASEGARVMCADVQAQALEQVVKDLRETGADAESLVCDVGDAEAVHQVLAHQGRSGTRTPNDEHRPIARNRTVFRLLPGLRDDPPAACGRCPGTRERIDARIR